MMLVNMESRNHRITSEHNKLNYTTIRRLDDDDGDSILLQLDDLFLAVFLNQFVDELGIYRLSLLRARAFELIPAVPFCLACKVEHTRAVDVTVAHSDLLVMNVQLEKLLICRLLGKILGGLGRSVELFRRHVARLFDALIGK